MNTNDYAAPVGQLISFAFLTGISPTSVRNGIRELEVGIENTQDLLEEAHGHIGSMVFGAGFSSAPGLERLRLVFVTAVLPAGLGDKGLV